MLMSLPFLKGERDLNYNPIWSNSLHHLNCNILPAPVFMSLRSFFLCEKHKSGLRAEFEPNYLCMYVLYMLSAHVPLTISEYIYSWSIKQLYTNH